MSDTLGLIVLRRSNVNVSDSHSGSAAFTYREQVKLQLRDSRYERSES